MPGGALARVVPAEVVVAVREVDVGLVEDGRPLEGRAVQPLAGCAVAVFGREGALARELVFGLAAMAGAVPDGGEGVGGAVELVRGPMLPGVLVGLGGGGVAVFVAVGGLIGGAWGAFLIVFLIVFGGHGGEFGSGWLSEE